MIMMFDRKYCIFCGKFLFSQKYLLLTKFATIHIEQPRGFKLFSHNV